MTVPAQKHQRHSLIVCITGNSFLDKSFFLLVLKDKLEGFVPAQLELDLITENAACTLMGARTAQSVYLMFGFAITHKISLLS